MQISQLVSVELLRDGFKRRLRRAVGDVVEGIDRRQADTDTTRLPDRQHRLGHFAQQASAVLNRTAVGIAPPVGPIAQKLIDQVAVGGMDFDAVESRGFGIGGGAPEILDQRRQFANGQRPRRHERLHTLFGVDLSGRLQRRGRHRQAAVGQRQRMRDPAHMPQLQEDFSAALMHRLRNRLPASDLLRAMNTRRLGIALPVGRDLGRLRDDQAGAGALAVITRHQGVGHVARGSAAACQRRHQDAIGYRQGAEHGGGEQDGCGIVVGAGHGGLEVIRDGASLY